MRQRARKLWFGDWQRDAEPDAADQSDTVVLTPEDAQPLPPEPRTGRRRDVAILAAAVLVLGIGFALSSGRDRFVSESPQTPPAQTPQVVPQIPQQATPPPQGFGGADLTGSAAIQAARAAIAKFPGNVERVTAGPSGGGYVVHVIQGDGNEVHVLVDGQFHVRGSDAQRGAPDFGNGRSQ